MAITIDRVYEIADEVMAYEGFTRNGNTYNKSGGQTFTVTASIDNATADSVFVEVNLGFIGAIGHLITLETENEADLFFQLIACHIEIYLLNVETGRVKPSIGATN